MRVVSIHSMYGETGAVKRYIGKICTSSMAKNTLTKSGIPGNIEGCYVFEIRIEKPGVVDEADLSTKQSQAAPQTRVSSKNEYQGGAVDPEPPPRQGTDPRCRIGAAGTLQDRCTMAAGSRPFPHDERMRHRWEFERVKKSGLTVRGRLMILSLASSPDQLERRVGFIVTRHYGGAVKRNLVRRRMREIYRLNRDRLKRGMHLVLIARSPRQEASYYQMNEEFLSLYRTAVTRLCGKG